MKILHLILSRGFAGSQRGAESVRGADGRHAPHPRERTALPGARRPDTPTEVAKLREEVGVAPHEFLVGCVARLARSKGLDTLIDAFTAAQLPDAKLVIFGEGRERKRLERRLGPHAQLAGFRRNVKDYYQAFDLFVCPSRREPLPLVMLEAFDAGVPIVASTADGCRELIEEYTGDLFPVEDVGALAALLRRHHAERPGRRRVDLSPHYIENVNATILDCYAELIAARQSVRAARR